jgi:hypothetical protein
VVHTNSLLTRFNFHWWKETVNAADGTLALTRRFKIGSRPSAFANLRFVERCLASSFAKRATRGARLACEADIEGVPASRVWLRRTSREADFQRVAMLNRRPWRTSCPRIRPRGVRECRSTAPSPNCTRVDFSHFETNQWALRSDEVEYTVVLFECSPMSSSGTFDSGETERLEYFRWEELPPLSVAYPAYIFLRSEYQATHFQPAT